ncbi:MAG: hypothetical protein WC758_00530 [Candidatus Woesearchaeota archaeon]|jgi:hypothetical protein
MDFNISLNETMINPISIDPKIIITNVTPLAILIACMAIYSIFIFNFYKYLAKRDILKANWNNKYSWEEGHLKRIFKTLLYILEFIIVVPIIEFFWFLVMAAILLILSNNSASQILLISMAIIAATRITAYYDEMLSVDLAKMIPFTLLGVFILDMQFFSIDSVLMNAKDMFSNVDKLIFYLLFAVAIEFILRIQQLIRNSIKKSRGLKNSKNKKNDKSNKNKKSIESNLKNKETASSIEKEKDANQKEKETKKDAKNEANKDKTDETTTNSKFDSQSSKNRKLKLD